MTQIPRVSSFPRLRWLAFWLLMVLVFVFAVVDWQGQQSWKDYVAERKAKGDSIDPASVIPPPIPDAENFAMAPLFRSLFDYTLAKDGRGGPKWRDPAAKEALERVTLRDGAIPTRHGDWPNGHFVDLIAWQTYFRGRPDFPKSPKPQAAGEDVFLALSKFDQEYAELREASARPRSRFPVRYEDGVKCVYPHYAVLVSMSGIADLRAVAELSVNRSEAAAQDVLLVLRLADSIEAEPLLLGLLVRESLVQGALEPIWEGLVRQQWTEEQLAALDARLAQIDLAASYQASIRGERNIGLFSQLDSNRGKRKALASLMSPDEKSSVEFGVLTLLLPGGVFDANKVSAGEWYDKVLACADPGTGRFFPDRFQRFDDDLQAAIHKNPYRPGSFLVQFLVPGLSHHLPRCAEIQESVNLVRVAIALERHCLRHGDYPEKLQSLDPEAAPNGLPPDVATGRPAHYTRTADGKFTLYYEGWNEVDDGGKMVWRLGGEHWHADFEKGDWVWPWPEP